MSLYRSASLLVASVLVFAVAATDPAHAAEAGVTPSPAVAVAAP